MNSKIFNWIFFIIIILFVVAIIVKNWSWISGSFASHKCKESDSNLDCVKKLGAVKSTNTAVGDRYDFPQDPNDEYGFYSNNRAIRFADKKMGTYDKVKITFDDGSTVTLNEIFSKK